MQHHNVAAVFNISCIGVLSFTIVSISSDPTLSRYLKTGAPDVELPCLQMETPAVLQKQWIQTIHRASMWSTSLSNVLGHVDVVVRFTDRD